MLSLVPAYSLINFRNTVRHWGNGKIKMSALLQATVTWILPTGMCSHLSRLLHMDIEKMDWQSISGVIECLRPYESWFTKSKKQNSSFYLNSPVRKFIYSLGAEWAKLQSMQPSAPFLKKKQTQGSDALWTGGKHYPQAFAIYYKWSGLLESTTGPFPRVGLDFLRVLNQKSKIAVWVSTPKLFQAKNSNKIFYI